MPRNKRSPIPLCRSPFLQDVTIALGRRSLKGVRYQGTLEFELVEENGDSGAIERLNVESRTLRNLTQISIWADGISWICYWYLRDKTSRSEMFKTHANLAGMDVFDVAELLHDSLRDLDSVKDIWEQRAIPS